MPQGTKWRRVCVHTETDIACTNCWLDWRPGGETHTTEMTRDVDRKRDKDAKEMLSVWEETLATLPVAGWISGKMEIETHSTKL